MAAGDGEALATDAARPMGETKFGVTTMMSYTDRSDSRVVRNNAPHTGMSLSSGMPLSLLVVVLR